MAKQTFIWSAAGVITNATEQELELPVREGSWLICYDRLTLVDETSSPTSVKIGLKAGTSVSILDGRATPGVDIPFSVAGKVFAPSSYRPCARFSGASLGDRIAFYAYGYLTDEVS